MMSNYKNDPISWREIVLEHLRKILECSRTEFRGGFTTTSGNNPPIYTYVPDTRDTYCNAVLSLSDVLLPFFDKKMEKASEEVEKKIGITMKHDVEFLEIRNIQNQNMAKKQFKSFSSRAKLDLCRQLFRELNLLLNRIDYLKTAIYEEGEEEEEGEEKEK